NVGRRYSIERASGGPPVNIPAPPTVITDISTSYSFPPHDVSLGAYTLNAGDRVCMEVTANPGSGTVNSSGDIVTSGAVASSKQCTPIMTKQFFKVYGNDVISGGEFSNGSPGQVCSAQKN